MGSVERTLFGGAPAFLCDEICDVERLERSLCGY